MKETTRVSKRPREEEEVESSREECSKKYKPQNYNHILSLLESDEDESSQDPSSIITTLQQELNHSQQNTQAQAQAQAHSHFISSSSSQSQNDDSHSNSKVDDVREEDKDKDRVMILRHLLEASDDELGIPSSREEDIDDELVGLDLGFGYDGGLNGEANGYPFCDGLWELEDETANYYALVQSQLFN